MQRMFVVQAGRILQFFSITDLLKTLFSPFRQDSLETKGAPIGVKLQVMGGNIISRFFGFVVRTVLIVAGLFTVALHYAFGAVVVVAWPLAPFSLVVAIVLTMFGVGV